MVLRMENIFTKCETGYVEHINIHNERTHRNLQALRFHHANQPTGTYALYRYVNAEPVTCMKINDVPAKQLIVAPHLSDKTSGVSSKVCKCQYFMEINGCTRAGKLLFWLASIEHLLQQNTSYCACDNI